MSRDRGTDCPSPLHDHPLPSGYVAASCEADERLEGGWDNRGCPDCHQFGWEPPQIHPSTQIRP